MPRQTLAVLRRWLRPGALVAAFTLVAGLIVSMGWLVLEQIDDFGTANSDNIQWSLSQADAEFFRFRLALAEARRDPQAAPDVRRRFDVFYSRIDTIRRGAVYDVIHDRSEVAAPLADVTAFLDDAVPLIDGDDAALHAALPRLAARADALTPRVRAMSLAALAAFAELSDDRRHEMIGTLVRMAGLLIALVGGLALIALTLLRLYRLSETRAREIREAGRRMQTIVETSLDAIVVCDAEGRILELNGSGRRMFGFDPGEAIGQPALSLLFPDEDIAARREDTLRFLAENRRPAPRERRLELQGRSRSGRAFPVEISVDRAEGADGGIYVAYLRDISHRKAAEDALTHARDRALAGERTKAEFLAVMSHEMRTPLNGLLGTLQLIRDTELDPRQAELVDAMHRSGTILLDLVNDVLDLSKLEAGKMQLEERVFDVSRLLDGVVDVAAPIAARNGTELSWTWMGAAPPRMAGDPRRLRQVLLKLVGNAAKFTKGGSVRIECACPSDGSDLTRFTVTDTGIGISAAALRRIFNDFETLDTSRARQVGGTGLGLGIVRRLVALMEGEIEASSTPGAGSRFVVGVPLRRATAPDPATAPVPAADTAAPQPLSVLLVEDNEINRFVARGLLEAEGHTVTEAVDGADGVARADATRFDVILMDISMPVMDGQEAARRIRSGGGASAGNPIVAVTAHALPEDVPLFHKAGMAAYLSKPIERKALSALLREVTADAPQTPEADGQQTPDTPPLVDADQLADLRATIGDDGIRDLVARLDAETAPAIRRLAGAEPTADWLGPEAHKCAGSCAAFGLVRLRTTLSQIEAGTRRGTPPDRAVLAALPSLWRDSRVALDALIGEREQA
ncbi:PAS domain S-box-containing protein [Tranquillimonas rosea]|uniref:histidine kinase n=1 Tax=Tranquillimonas rosea TaxID=641238 RepID=A0A1H9PZQ6_9RHOB|nr:ATP-binding protein [Tranquillimonas rosea]SER53662.1 PAS domain S-box-containing protein [Tranquillimonas rosea]